MKDNVLIGQGATLLSLPNEEWQKNMAGVSEIIGGRLAFMTDDHHRVRYYVVREMPRYRRPIPPQAIADDLDLSLNQVVSLLGDLEKNLTFLYRNPEGKVTWAYPVTCDQTPHQVTFSSGEIINAA